MESWLHDFRFSLRSLAKSPGFTGVALVLMGLGLGANVAIFSVVNGVLLRALPVHEPDRLVTIWTSGLDVPKGPLSARDVATYRDEATLFEGIAAGFGGWDGTLTAGKVPRHVLVKSLTYDFFSVLGVEPVWGRGFLPEDGVPPPRDGDATQDDLPPVVLLSHELWQAEFGQDPAILGRMIALSGFKAQVVGVMPPGFQIPQESEVTRSRRADLWMAIRFDLSRGSDSFRNMRAIGRLRPGVSLEQAQSQMDALMAQRREVVEDYRNLDLRNRVIPMHDDVVGHVRPALILLSGAVGFLLLLVCANLANLELVRAWNRRGEIAVRAAMGCGRHRLVRQLFTESLVLSVTGALLGLALGWLGVRYLLLIRPAELPGVDAIGVSLPVVAFALGLSVLAAVLFGLAPALGSGRDRLTEALRGQARAVGGGRGLKLLDALVVGEVTLSVLLVLGAALMMRSFGELRNTDPGFDPEGVLTFTLGLYGEPYESGEARAEFFRELEGRIEALPGVDAVGGNYLLPLTSGLWTVAYAFDEDSHERWPAETADHRVVTRGYFDALGTRFVAGRDFTEAETTRPAAVVIVDDKLARRAWPGEDPIGKILAVEQGDQRPELEVVGVVEHVRAVSLESEGREAIYRPNGSMPLGRMKFAVRTTLDPTSLAQPVRSEVSELDPGLAIFDVSTMREIMDGALAPTRFLMVLMTVFAVLAMVVAAVGLYGVVAYAVRLRTSEIGLRMAFGARRVEIFTLVVGRGVKLVLLGVGLGIVAALALTRFIGALLYGVATTDPVSTTAVAALLAAVALLACYLPARRASSIDPITALRTD